ncbi:unnamed protein product [Spodoptera littoralis]|uniref:Uncharacterized protein n=1 Tax=Spodoptera littoralis TaxID=7109 RepID=A0A9P0I0B7_SPOLI|nr:unnamed protein product [Spodoptera littoralis]CAH1637707.1 unnamed protein product [Spodoptera littoralis]
MSSKPYCLDEILDVTVLSLVTSGCVTLCPRRGWRPAGGRRSDLCVYTLYLPLLLTLSSDHNFVLKQLFTQYPITLPTAPLLPALVAANHGPVTAWTKHT